MIKYFAACCGVGARRIWMADGDVMSIRECHATIDVDMTTLLWTRNRSFPLCDLASRMMCPTCGSRRVALLFMPPAEPGRATATRTGWE